MSSSNNDDSTSTGYSVITENQERMAMIDIYFISTIGLTLGTMIIYSLSKARKNQRFDNNNNTYSEYAFKFVIMSAIASICLFLMKIFFCTDLIFPWNYSKNINIATLLDAFFCIFWSIERITFYYGFTFIYLSLFQKDKIDILLKIMLVLIAFGTIGYMIVYFIFDLMTTTLDEISIGQKREISIVLPYGHMTMAEIIIIAMAIMIDFLMAILLMFRFYKNKYKKGIILLVLPCIFWVFLYVINETDADFKYMFYAIPIIIDMVCLYLMFDDNQEMYNDLCGSICGSSTYEAIAQTDYDPDDNFV